MFDFPALTKPFYQVRRITRRLWVRMALIALLALVAAGSSPWLALLLPQGLAESVEKRAVERILEILASSMLTVTTFSLSVMVAARQWSSSQSTPRAQQLMREDAVTQNALATFLGAFVFALVSYILLTTGAYGRAAEAVILGFTLVVVALVVVAILRWIHHLTSLGGVDQTAGRVEEATADAMALRRKNPCLGAHPLTDDTSRDGLDAVVAHETGYVRHVDASKLQDCAGEGRVLVLAGPGRFVARGEPLALAAPDADADAVRDAFTMARSRSFEQDPLFGLEVLSEIAERALSPGINDPGTAVGVVRRITRLLMPDEAGNGDEREDADEEVKFDRVHIPPLDPAELCRTAFAGIARCAGSADRVHVALQAAFRRLAEADDAALAKAARAESERALAFAGEAIHWDADLERVRDASP